MADSNCELYNTFIKNEPCVVKTESSKTEENLVTENEYYECKMLDAYDIDIKDEPLAVISQNSEEKFTDCPVPDDVDTKTSGPSGLTVPMFDSQNKYFNEMGKSRAEYMRNYRQKKREKRLKTGVQPKKIARNSTQRSRDFRARAANTILTQTPTTDPTIA